MSNYWDTYKFGKFLNNLDDCIPLFFEKLEEGKFDKFLEENEIDRKKFIFDANIKSELTSVSEAFNLGINYDIDLNDIFKDHKDADEIVSNIIKVENEDGYIGSGDSTISYEDKDLVFIVLYSAAFDMSEMSFIDSGNYVLAVGLMNQENATIHLELLK